MKNFFKKLVLLFTLGFGAIGLASCQGVDVNKEARFELEKCYVQIVTVEETGKRYAEFSLYVVNNSIYNVYSWDITLTGYSDAKCTTEVGQYVAKDVVLKVGHGVGGLIIGKEEVQEDTVAAIKVTNAKVSQYYNLWQTYVGWFICAIAIVAFSWIFFGISIFAKGITKEEARQLLQARLASTLLIALFILVICMIPIFFGGWVISLIFLGSVVASMLGAILMTCIKYATLK